MKTGKTSKQSDKDLQTNSNKKEVCPNPEMQCKNKDAQKYACKILDLHNSKKILLEDKHPSGVEDNAYAYNNINDACHGRAASRSNYTKTCGKCSAPGGHVCLDPKLLQYIYKIGCSGYIKVNEIAGACHSCLSRHYKGKAVDISKDDMKSERIDYFLSECRKYDQKKAKVEALNEEAHVHCAIPI